MAPSEAAFVGVARWFIVIPKNPKFGYISDGLGMKKPVYYMTIWHILRRFAIFYGHLVHFIAIWYILWSFGIFPRFWYVLSRKIWQP
jgi:hypothetical protein